MGILAIQLLNYPITQFFLVTRALTGILDDLAIGRVQDHAHGALLILGFAQPSQNLFKLRIFPQQPVKARRFRKRHLNRVGVRLVANQHHCHLARFALIPLLQIRPALSQLFFIPDLVFNSNYEITNLLNYQILRQSHNAFVAM